MGNNLENVGKRWAPEEEVRVTAMWLNYGYSVGQIAKIMRRDIGGIASRLSRMKLICGLEGGITGSDTAKSVAGRAELHTDRNWQPSKVVGELYIDVQVDATEAIEAVNEQQEKIMKEKINWALNLGFGGFFTQTDLGWYKTYDELPEDHWAMGAYPAFKEAGRPTALKVIKQTKECPPELKTQRLDFLMPQDQETTVVSLRQRDEATAVTVETSIRRSESLAEDDSIRESMGSGAMSFIETMLKPKLGGENLHKIAEAFGNMSGDEETAERLGNIANLADEVRKLIGEN